MARALYQEAATHCHSVKDYVTRDLFEKTHARRGGAHRLPRDAARPGLQLGVELYSQHHIGSSTTTIEPPDIRPGAARAHRQSLASRRIRMAGIRVFQRLTKA